jgi:uncharacterized phage protein (TIGR01671 family)
MYLTMRAWLHQLNKMSWEFEAGDEAVFYSSKKGIAEWCKIGEIYADIMYEIGKKDINNKKIFTNDIVKVEIYNTDHDEPILVKRVVGIVEFSEGIFDVVYYSKETGSRIWSGVNAEEFLAGTYTKWEVLGDTYRTPELLQKCIEY